MTEAELKKLAELAAEFLHIKGGFLTSGISGTVEIDLLNDPASLYDDMVASPILAHLAKREMEKRKLSWECHYFDGVGYSCQILNHYKSTGRYTQLSYKSQIDNEFIALWSAIEATGEIGK